MIEIPVQYLLTILSAIGLIFISLWTGLGIYFIAIKEIGAGIVILCTAVIFWLIIFTMIGAIVWV